MAGGRDSAFEEPTGDPAPGGASARGPGPVAPLTPGAVRWTDDATDRLARVPSFVRGMVKRIYADWAAERGIVEITPEIMDTARSDLGLEGM
jgi:hypothetical protein